MLLFTALSLLPTFPVVVVLAFETLPIRAVKPALGPELVESCTNK